MLDSLVVVQISQTRDFVRGVLVVQRGGGFATIVLLPLKRVCSEVEDAEKSVFHFTTGFALDLESLHTIVEVNGR